MESQLLTWSETYAIGHTGLDAEHRQLVATINKVCCAAVRGSAADELRPLLEALTISAVEHFKHENTLLRELGGLAMHFQASRPAIDNILSVAAVNEHCAEHARALLQLESIIRIFDDAQSDPGNLGKMLTDWFTAHALEHDADLREALKAYLAYTQSPRPGSRQDAGAAQSGPGFARV